VPRQPKRSGQKLDEQGATPKEGLLPDSTLKIVDRSAVMNGGGWAREFDETIPLPDGGELRTLLDAGRYIEALPRAQHNRSEWRTATKMLLMAAERRLPVMFANVALLRALEIAKRRKSRGGTHVKFTQAGSEPFA
jgi:hypothetical protein